MGFFNRKPKRKDSAPGPTPLTARQRALLDEEQKLKAKMKKMEDFVENAPKRAAEIQREQRDELLLRAATMHKGHGSKSLVDRRTTLEANVAAHAKERHIRSVRRQGRLMFVVLLVTLAGAIFYLYYTVTRG